MDYFFVNSNIKDFVFRSNIGLDLHYRIPKSRNVWSKAFIIMNQMRKDHDVEDYRIFQYSLIDVFCKV